MKKERRRLAESVVGVIIGFLTFLGLEKEAHVTIIIFFRISSHAPVTLAHPLIFLIDIIRIRVCK
jgi:hypothetical protein